MTLIILWFIFMCCCVKFGSGNVVPIAITLVMLFFLLAQCGG